MLHFAAPLHIQQYLKKDNRDGKFQRINDRQEIKTLKNFAEIFRKIIWQFKMSTKLRALRAHFLMCLACLRTHVSTSFAYLLAHVPTYTACLRARLLTCFMCLRAHVL